LPNRIFLSSGGGKSTQESPHAAAYFAVEVALDALSGDYMGTGFGQPAPGELVNRPLGGRLCCGQALATGAAGQTSVDLVAASAPGVLSANDITTSFRLQPEFVQRDVKLVRVDAPSRFGLAQQRRLAPARARAPHSLDVLRHLGNRGKTPLGDGGEALVDGDYAAPNKQEQKPAAGGLETSNSEYFWGSPRAPDLSACRCRVGVCNRRI